MMSAAHNNISHKCNRIQKTNMSNDLKLHDVRDNSRPHSAWPMMLLKQWKWNCFDRRRDLKWPLRVSLPKMRSRNPHLEVGRAQEGEKRENSRWTWRKICNSSQTFAGIIQEADCRWNNDDDADVGISCVRTNFCHGVHFLPETGKIFLFVAASEQWDARTVSEQKRTEQPQNIGNSGTASVGIFTFLPGTSLDITPKRKAMDTLNASNTNALRYADLKNILTPWQSSMIHRDF